MQKHVFLEVWENCLDEEEGGFEPFILLQREVLPYLVPPGTV